MLNLAQISIQSGIGLPLHLKPRLRIIGLHSYHSLITSQSEPPEDRPVRLVGSSGRQTSGSALLRKSEVSSALNLELHCGESTDRSGSRSMVSEGLRSTNGEERWTTVSEDRLSPCGEEWLAMVIDGLLTPCGEARWALVSQGPLSPRVVE